LIGHAQSEKIGMPYNLKSLGSRNRTSLNMIAVILQKST